MSVPILSIPTLPIIAVCCAAISAALYFAFLNARKRANAARGPVALDLGGRLPAKRRRPCGRHGEGGGDCDGCEHEHHDHDHADGGHCSREHCQK